MATGDARHRWWLCCQGHIFEHDPVPESGELQCPDFDDDGPCGTFFIYMPFVSRHEAEHALQHGVTARPKWAPWAR